MQPRKARKVAEPSDKVRDKVATGRAAPGRDCQVLEAALVVGQGLEELVEDPEAGGPEVALEVGSGVDSELERVAESESADLPVLDLVVRGQQADSEPDQEAEARAPVGELAQAVAEQARLVPQLTPPELDSQAQVVGPEVTAVSEQALEREADLDLDPEPVAPVEVMGLGQEMVDLDQVVEVLAVVEWAQSPAWSPASQLALEDQDPGRDAVVR